VNSGFLTRTIVIYCYLEFDSVITCRHCLFLYNVRSTARHAVHLNGISANTLEKALQSPKCIECCAVDCTPLAWTIRMSRVVEHLLIVEV
jgi:hypothetical protein